MIETVSPAKAAETILSLMPPLLQSAFTDDLDFLARYDLTVNAAVAFGDEPVFSRSAIFEAARSALAAETSTNELADENGTLWQISVHYDDGLPGLRFVCEGRSFVVSKFWALSPSREVRLLGFGREADAVGLIDSTAECWRAKLLHAPVSDDQFDKLRWELRITPKQQFANICAKLRAGTVSIEDLVPRELRYYERLAGTCTPAMDLRSFVAAGGAEHFASLNNWHGVEGLKLGLVLSWHSSLSVQPWLVSLPEKDIRELYAWVMKDGDLISCVSAIEFGLAHLDRLSWLEETLRDLIIKVSHDNASGSSGRHQLLSCLGCLVLGEMSRRGIGRDRPPYWRRLAALAHASLIERAVIATGCDIESIANWAVRERGKHFYLQTMVDLRTEPRWLPDFLSADQLKAEFLGRINAAAHSNESKVRGAALRERLFGDSGIRNTLVLSSLYPGPLDGATEPTEELPKEFVKTMEQQLVSDVLAPKSFALLLNLALVYRITPDHVRLAVEALRRVKYRLHEVGDGKVFFSLLSGLAVVAAVTRSQELADEVRLLTRVSRRAPRSTLERDDEFRVALVAAASRPEAKEWARFLGEWLNEIALEQLTPSMAANLATNIRYLQSVDPLLRTSCAKAEAALAAASHLSASS